MTSRLSPPLAHLFAFAAACALFFAVPALQAQEIKGNAQAGEKKIAMCIGCHGIKGYQASFPEVYRVPMISGQGAPYIAAALNAYKKGERKHPSMRGIAESLSDQDIADLSAFYANHGAGQGAPLAEKASKEPSAKVADLLKKGGCVACHGANYAKPLDPSYPKIAGQHSDYLFVALKAYKVEGNPQVGRSNPMMVGMTKPYSNNDLKAMAAYISSLDGDLKTIPENKFR